jgi:hypothetical protein
MSKEPISLLGYFVQTMREKHGYRRRTLARLVGFTDGKAGAASIRLLEDFGQVDPPDLLDRLADALLMTADELISLDELDRAAAGEWLKKISQPVVPYFGIKLGPMANQINVPEEIANCEPEAIEAYASDFARSRRLPVRLHICSHICFVFDRVGELVEIQELGRDGFILG